ncbi:alcohol dehydrogenase [Pseudomonas sp. NFIX10]|uniref:quinone oxidoreductase family protein n=1 Tax=unclassified Pseudomonas TaxID=196821 RepID=UPI0008E80B3A|nr:alcohol dehydrogenase [Pseudomonas sp. NFIX10]SFE54762.1 alcohol dehydrogenase [Pseudomonas sp. NFACC06-1]
MKAWQLDGLGGPFRLCERSQPQPRPGSVVVHMEASVLMSYMKDYVEGKLPVYRAPEIPFIPGGNGVGVIQAIGENVWHLKVGQRVVISSHLVAHENVRDPGQILVGVTAQGPIGRHMQQDWPDGTLSEYAVVPASLVTPVDGLEQLDAAQLAVTMRHVVPYGGLLRGRLAAGETLLVSGATGAYGSAGALLGLAMGAARVIALGRDRRKLDKLATVADKRLTTLVATGDMASDVERIHSLTGGGVDMALDMVGGATDAGATLTALRSLVDGGRLVLMGSMAVPLPLPYTEVMLHAWEVIGNFMYSRDAYRRLLELIRSGLLDISAIRPRVFSIRDLPEAMEAARRASGLECVVINHRK